MNIRVIFASFTRKKSSLLLYGLFTIVISGNNHFSQEPDVIRKNIGKNALMLSRAVEISEASEDCTPVECQWWERLRQAGHNLQRKGDNKARRQFVLLLLEGIERSYRVPVKDQPPLVLLGSRPVLTPEQRQTANGEVAMLVEYGAEGSVGEIKLVEGKNKFLNKSCIDSARQSFFLPAIKDHSFVTEWGDGKCSFFAGAISR